VAAWLSGSTLVSINEVILRRSAVTRVSKEVSKQVYLYSAKLSHNGMGDRLWEGVHHLGL